LKQHGGDNADRAVNLAYAAITPLLMPVVGWLVTPDAGGILLRFFLGYSAVLLGFCAGMHFVAALWLEGLADTARRRLLFAYLPLPLLGWWVAIGPGGMETVLISLLGWSWVYLAAIWLGGSATLSAAPDWLLRIRRRMVWTAAACHLVALGWLARMDFLAG